MTPWTAAYQASLSFTISWNLLKLTSTESVMPFSHFLFCRHFLLLSSIFPSVRVFSNESVLYIRWPKFCSFNFNISPSKEYLGLFSFRIERFVVLAVQRTLKSLLQHHSSKPSILHSAFFMVQLSHQYMTTGKNIALTIQTFFSKVISLLFNILYRFVIALLPKSKCLFNFMAAVVIHSDFRAQENKICSCFYFFPIHLPWNDGTRCHDLNFWMLSFNSVFSLSSFTLIKRLCSSLLSAIRVVSSAYLRLLIFLLAILILAWASSSLAFCMMYPAQKLNKLGVNIQACCATFSILDQSVVPCLVLTAALWTAYRFFRR